MESSGGETRALAAASLPNAAQPRGIHSLQSGVAPARSVMLGTFQWEKKGVPAAVGAGSGAALVTAATALGRVSLRRARWPGGPRSA